MEVLATKSVVLHKDASITAAELEAASNLVSFITAYYQGHDKALEAIRMTHHLDYTAERILNLADMV